MKITKEIAEAFGYRDRCLGVDAESRNITLDRFRGWSRVTRVYWDGWAEADHYVDNHWRWGIEAAERGKCHIRIDGYPYHILLRCSKRCCVSAAKAAARAAGRSCTRGGNWSARPSFQVLRSLSSMQLPVQPPNPPKT